MSSDYDSVPNRVVDICRASALFSTMMQLAHAIEALLKDGCPLIVVRAKDRLNNPTSFGYADLLLNVRLADGPHSGHVGELQLHLDSMHAIKPMCHRVYAILRQLGWEDDEFHPDRDATPSKAEDGAAEDGDIEVAWASTINPIYGLAMKSTV